MSSAINKNHLLVGKISTVSSDKLDNVEGSLDVRQLLAEELRRSPQLNRELEGRLIYMINELTTNIIKHLGLELLDTP